MKSAQIFCDEEIFTTLCLQINWSHFKLLIPIKDELQRDFYTQMCRIKGWSVQTLQNKIDSMLFERTALSKIPDTMMAVKKNVIVAKLINMASKRTVDSGMADGDFDGRAQLTCRVRHTKY